MQADKTIFNTGAELLDIKFNTKEGENMKVLEKLITAIAIVWLVIVLTLSALNWPVDNLGCLIF